MLRFVVVVVVLFTGDSVAFLTVHSNCKLCNAMKLKTCRLLWEVLSKHQLLLMLLTLPACLLVVGVVNLFSRIYSRARSSPRIPNSYHCRWLFFSFFLFFFGLLVVQIQSCIWRVYTVHSLWKSFIGSQPDLIQCQVYTHTNITIALQLTGARKIEKEKSKQKKKNSM